MDEGREMLPQSFDPPEAKPTALAGKNLLPPQVPRRTLLGYGIGLGIIGYAIHKLLGRGDATPKPPSLPNAR